MYVQPKLTIPFGVLVKTKVVARRFLLKSFFLKKFAKFTGKHLQSTRVFSKIENIIKSFK